MHRKRVDVLVKAFRRYREVVIFEGFGHDRHVAKPMTDVRCFILPGCEDRWGTVVCEAMACGTSVIATRWACAVDDFIRTAINSWVINEMRPAAWAQAMGAVSSWGAEAQENAHRSAIGFASGYVAGSYVAAFSALSRPIMASD